MADAFGGHLTLRAMKKINKYRFYFVLLSAGLTWLLQPLDVQTFVCVKRFLRDRYAQVPEQEPEPRLILTSLRDLLAAIAKYFVHVDWSSVFDSIGLNGACQPYSKLILTELEWEAFPPIPRERPTEEVIRLNTPGGRRLHPDYIAGCLPRLPPHAI